MFCEHDDEEFLNTTGHVPTRLIESLKKEGFVVIPQKDYDKLMKRIADLENELLHHGHRDIVRGIDWK